MLSLSLDTPAIVDPFAPEFNESVAAFLSPSPKQAPSLHLSSAPAIIPAADYFYHDRRMSTATTATTSAESDSAPPSHASPRSSSSSPRAPSDDPAQAVQLPPIFSSLPPDGRRGSLPSLSSSSASVGYSSSSLSSYQFPPVDNSAAASDRKSSLGLAYDSPLGTSSSSGPTSSIGSSSAGYASSFEFGAPRAHGSADYDQWSTTSSGSIARSNSTPSGQPLASLPYSFPPSTHSTPPVAMYGTRIAGQSDRRGSYAQSATADHVKEEWGTGMSDYLGANPAAQSSASSTSNGASPSPNPSPALPPPSLVDRPQKKRGKLPKPTTDFLKDWLHRHADHPYPSEEEKKQLCAATGLSMSQVSNWMINARRRILAPVHRSQSNPSTTQPLGGPRPSMPGSIPPPSGVSTATLLRRASMPTDGLQLFHPLSLQSLPGSHVSSTDPYYHPTRSVGAFYGASAGRSSFSGPSAGYSSGYAFPGGGVTNAPQPYGAASSGLPMPYVPSQSHGASALGLSTGAMYGGQAQGGQQGGYLGRGDQHSSPGSAGYGTPQ